MSGPRVSLLLIVLAGLMAIAPSVSAATRPAEQEAMYHRYLEFPARVKGGAIQPHWLADGGI